MIVAAEFIAADVGLGYMINYARAFFRVSDMFVGAFTIGLITFAITVIAAVAAWSARETYRIHIKDLGQPGAVPVDKGDYDRMRAASMAAARLARA